jgi:hypothetical protein
MYSDNVKTYTGLIGSKECLDENIILSAIDLTRELVLRRRKNSVIALEVPTVEKTLKDRRVASGATPVNLVVVVSSPFYLA